MCTNATKTAASLMAAIEPTIKSLLTETNLLNTPNGIAAINAYDAALAALEAWKSGTNAQNVLAIIADFQTVFNALPLPANAQVLTNIVLAGVEAVIGVISANSPAPVSPTPVAAADAEEDTQASHQAQVIAETTAKINALVPNFKRSIWHSAASQYTNTWNSAIDTGGFPETMRSTG